MKVLFHYVHCPFCVRVRLALGHLKIDFESKVLTYDDRDTPVELCQKKMLPIFQWNEGEQSNESLDIIKKLDTKDNLSMKLLEDESLLNEMNTYVQSLGALVHPLAMPYWIWTPEFDENSRKYFLEQKEKKRGPFNHLVQNKNEYLDKLASLLDSLSPNLNNYFKRDEFSILDIMIASHLWGMYVVPEYQFPNEWHLYLQRVKASCQFEYHQDFWN